MRLGALTAVVVALCTGGLSTPTAHALDDAVLRSWGMETYGEIEETLRVPGSNLYAETASLTGRQSGGLNGKSYAWPASTQFRVLNTLTQIDPETYGLQLRAFSDELRSAYWDRGYRSGAGGGDRYYDDNAHLVVALAEAYKLTLDPVYLTRARETLDYVKQGEDAVAGGGIYFKENSFTSKDTISTLQAARGAAMLYLTTGESGFLTDATRLLDWSESHVQRTDGIYYQRWAIGTNQPTGVELINAAGIGISLNIELYRGTGESHFLAEAQRIAARSLNRYFDSTTGRINDEGYWAFELVDGLNELYLEDGNPLWLDHVHGALSWLHEKKRDPHGHYGLYWGRNGAQAGQLVSWNLNEQAAVARAYLYTSTVPEPSVAGLLGLSAGLLGTSRRRRES
ncbi:MAG: glycoside hydrolase family 76 protein [Chthoniobacteraceae bacterium]